MQIAPFILAPVGQLGWQGDVPGGGVCVARTWVTLRAGDKTRYNRDPDGIDYQVVTRDGHRWQTGSSAYGFSPDANGAGWGPIAFRQQGYALHRMRYLGSRGYLVAKTRRLTNGATETLLDADNFAVWGSAFAGTVADRAFFKRLDLSNVASVKCQRFWKLFK